MSTEYGESAGVTVQVDGPYSGTGTGGANVKCVEITLALADWKNASSPYMQDVTISGMSVHTKVDIQPTVEQAQMLKDSGIALVCANTSGAAKVYAIGAKPDTTLTLQAALTETVNAVDTIWGDIAGFSHDAKTIQEIMAVAQESNSIAEAAQTTAGEALSAAAAAQSAASGAQTAASNAQSAANGAQTAAKSAQTAAAQAVETANEALDTAEEAQTKANEALEAASSGTIPSTNLPTIPITKGGTGATTATEALTNLGALSKSGGTMKGALNMGSYRITNLANPSATTDAVNKTYADAIDTKASEAQSAAKTAQETANAAQSTASGAQAAAENAQAAAEEARTRADEALEAATSGTIPTTQLPTVPISKGGTGATTAAAALTNLGALSKNGDTMKGALNMGSYRIINVAAPTATTDAVNKSYADAIDTKATEAKEAAANAQATANTAKTAAANAQTAADNAQSTADDALEAASSAASNNIVASRLPTIPVSKGGTGLTSVTANNFLVGNGTGAMVQKTAAQVLTMIGGTKMATTTVSLPKANWASKTQTVSASGVTASNAVIVTPAPASFSAYSEAAVCCTAQASGTLTFICERVPEANLSVNVLILS